MRVLGKIALLFLWTLFLSCDLLFNKPDGDLMQDIEDSVWDSNAPRLEVAMDYIAGAGTTNFAKGPIVPQPKQRIEFAVSFAVNPEYGFVEWRAYETGKRPGSEEEWRSVAASLEGILRFGSPRDLSTTVLIDSDKGLITLEPFCVRRPEVDHSDPVWTGSSNRFYTNQPIRIWFTMPVERDSVREFNNISISAVTFQGMGTTVDLVSQGYFLPPELDENGTMLLINPNMGAYPEGIPPNSDITIRLDLSIRHDAFTDIEGGAGLRMARPFTISYGTTGGPDKSVPEVHYIRGAEQETDQLFHGNESPPVTIRYRGNKAELFLLFNAYKPTDTPIRNVRIYEEPVPEAGEAPYPVEELAWNAWGALERQYIDAYGLLPELPPLSGSGRTKVRYRIRTKKAEQVRLYILPEDSLGNKVAPAEAKAKGYFVPVTIDPPPEPVIVNPPGYDPAMKQIKLSWEPPASQDEVTTLEILWKKNGETVAIPNSTIPAPYDYRFAAGAWDVPNIGGENDDEYAIIIKASDGDGNDSLSEPVTVRAKQPKPITGVNTVYDSAAKTITVSWDDPGIANLQDQLVYWTKDGNPAGDPVSIGKDDRSYVLENVPDDSSVYRFTVIAVDTAGNETASGETGLSPGGGIIHVPPVTGLVAAYDPGGAISASWTNPSDTALTGLSLAWNNGAGVSGAVELEPADAYVINNIDNNSGLYTITVRAKNGAIGSVPAVIQVNTAVVPPVTGLTAGYSLETRKITVSWTNPPNVAFTGLTLGWSNGEGVSQSIDLGKISSHSIVDIANNSGIYALELRAKKGTVLSAAATARVDTAVTTTPRPVTGLSAVYIPASQEILASWTNPVDEAFTGLTLGWNNAAGVFGSIDLDKADSHSIAKIPNNSGIYTITVGVKNGEIPSTAAIAQVDTAVTTTVSPVTGLSATYNPAAQSIALGWTNPPAFTGLTLAWDNGAGVSGSLDLGTVSAHTIAGIANNSGTYSVTVRVKNGAVLSAAATAQVDTAVTPPPVTGLSATYNPAAQSIALGWTNPADAAFTGLTLAWDNGAGVSGSLDLGTVSAHTIADIANNSGTYSVTVRAKNGAVLSAAATVSVATTLAPVDERVSAFDLTGLVVAPVTGAAPNTGAIDHTQYTGSVAWKESDGTTAVGGNFAGPRVYQAVVTLTARPGYTFDGVAANVFSYAGAAATNPAGTGATIEATITFPATADPSLPPGLRYVKEGGTGNGSSWENASGDLQKMIDGAGADRGANIAIVRVAAGTYTPRYKPDSNGASVDPPVGAERDRTFMLRSGVEILGGYPAEATNATNDLDRNWAENLTILSGDIDNNDTAAGIIGNNAHHVVLGVDVSGAVLDGFAIRGGKADGSAGITVRSKAVEKSSGGGIYIDSSSPVLTNLTITGNVASGNGGGMHLVSSPSLLTNAVIAGNAAASGGGIYNTLSASILTNVTVAGNTATSGGGICFADNSFNANPLKIRNSIIWGNSDSIMIVSGGPTFDYSIIQGGWPGAGGNNLHMDPAFVSPATGNYRLTIYSPAINRGSDSYYQAGQTPDLSAITTDIGGAARSVGGTIDMGAYEEPGGIKPEHFPITLVIDRGQGAFSENTFTIYKSGGSPPGSRIVAVTGTEYSDPHWYVDGVLKASGNSITIEAKNYGTGGHSLSLWVKIGDVPWSKELDFTVAD